MVIRQVNSKKNLKTLKWNTKKCTNKEQKRQDKGNKGMKNKGIKQKANNKMVDLNLNISVITSHVNDLYIPTKRGCQNGPKKKVMTQHMLYMRNSFQIWFRDSLMRMKDIF